MVDDSLLRNLKEYEDTIKKTDSNKRGEFVKNLIDETVAFIRSEFHPRTMMDNDEIFLHFNGYYHQNGDKYIRSMCDKIFGKYYNGSIWKSILDKIKASTTLERRNFKEPLDKINLKNGVLDINTLKLEEHSHVYNFLYKIEINYNEYAKCPKIEKFLHEAVTDDSDFLCLQEFIGFTLYPEYKYDRLLVIHGSGGHNRKSKTFSLITNMLGGIVNVSSSDMQSLSKDRFECSMLYGKKANICNDISSEKIDLTGQIKRLLGYDVITAQRKHERQFQFINSAKLLFSCNKLPVIADDTDAWWNKVILLDFSKDFKDDPVNLMDTLMTREEMEGFLIFAVQGLKRLNKNKEFTYNYDLTRYRWIKSLEGETENPIEKFKNDYLDIGVGVDSHIFTDILFVKYNSCNGNKPVTKSIFTKTILKDKRIGFCRPLDSDGKQRDAYTNVKFKDGI